MVLSFINKIKDSLTKTRVELFGSLSNILPAGANINEDVLEKVEEVLYEADLGVHAAEMLVEELRGKASEINRQEIDPFTVMKGAVLEIFNEEGKYFVRGGATTFPGLQHSINFKNLTFSYFDDRQVLQGVSFDVQKGKMTAIVGPTGGGKSTLISLLMRYYDCPPSTLFIDGTDIREFTLESYLGRVALVSQETLLLHDTLRYNITYGLHDVSEERLQEALKRARLQDFIGKLPQGLDTLIGDRGVRLSGGEKQRVSIARALLKNAEILILDEATSSLDSRTEALIQEAIDDAVSGRTSIVIAHRLSTIKHADKIIVVDEGRIAEQGMLQELLEKEGAFFALWEQQRF